MCFASKFSMFSMHTSSGTSALSRTCFDYIWIGVEYLAPMSYLPKGSSSTWLLWALTHLWHHITTGRISLKRGGYHVLVTFPLPYYFRTEPPCGRLANCACFMLAMMTPDEWAVMFCSAFIYQFNHVFTDSAISGEGGLGRKQAHISLIYEEGEEGQMEPAQRETQYYGKCQILKKL